MSNLKSMESEQTNKKINNWTMKKINTYAWIIWPELGARKTPISNISRMCVCVDMSSSVHVI